jgi:hypothetical protein
MLHDSENTSDVRPPYKEPTMTTNPNPAPQNQELRSVFTGGLAELFAELNLSLVV